MKPFRFVSAFHNFFQLSKLEIVWYFNTKTKENKKTTKRVKSFHQALSKWHQLFYKSQSHPAPQRLSVTLEPHKQSRRISLATVIELQIDKNTLKNQPGRKTLIS